MNKSKTIPQDTKKLFWKLGTCSRTFFYILNRHFGYLKETEERAADPFAGGIMQKGRQCGMLWGSALAVGAEAFRRHGRGTAATEKNRGTAPIEKDCGKAIAVAITATQHLLESFSNMTNNVNCRDITNCDLTSKLGMLKLILFKSRACTRQAVNWAPEAIRSATEGLSRQQPDLPQLPISCASEVAKKMGVSDEEMVMVAGFAGGLGLSGNACGALSAAIWINTLALCRKENRKSTFSNPKAKKTLKAFYDATDSEILCHKIAGRYFKTIDDHTEFMKKGGCDKLMNVLAGS